ncbi:MAG: hypothetical protein ABJN40_14910 [Sneathiella sp.]
MGDQRRRNLVIFDIDGTLMHSAGHDESLFKIAHETHVGAELTEQHWGNFTHMTDHAINTEFFERIHGRPGHEEEVAAIKSTFLDLVEDAHTAAPHKFAPVEGSLGALERLLGHSDWTVCFASGGWGVSSSFKLSTLGITADQHPTAFGDTHSDRLTLVTAAIDAAKEHASTDRFDHMVSIGDGIWDVETAKILEIPFIGISSWVAAETLKNAGASHILDHYGDLDHFETCLNEARVPG